MHAPANDVIVPFFIMGTMFGIIATLLVQLYGRRKARQVEAKLANPDRAIELLSNENEQQQGLILRLEERLTVLERIATDKPARLSAEIDSLR